MFNEKDLLIASAARLYSMGVDLEAARERLRQAVQTGVDIKDMSVELKRTRAAIRARLDKLGLTAQA